MEVSTHLSAFPGWADSNQRAGLIAYLWERFYPLAVRRCLASGIQMNDAEDIAQGVWLNMLPHFDEFVNGYQRTEPRRAQFRPWLLICTRNAIYDYFERTNRSAATLNSDHPDMDLAETIATDFDECEIADDCLQEAVRFARERVTVRTWQAFIERVVHGRAYRDIADGVMTVDATEACVRRVRLLIRNAYERCLMKRQESQ